MEQVIPAQCCNIPFLNTRVVECGSGSALFFQTMPILNTRYKEDVRYGVKDTSFANFLFED